MAVEEKQGKMLHQSDANADAKLGVVDAEKDLYSLELLFPPIKRDILPRE